MYDVDEFSTLYLHGMFQLSDEDKNTSSINHL
jgi:hypothetical protein